MKIVTAKKLYYLKQNNPWTEDRHNHNGYILGIASVWSSQGHGYLFLLARVHESQIFVYDDNSLELALVIQRQ